MFSGFSKNEKRVLIVSLILMLICLALSTSESLFLRATGLSDSAQEIGTIEVLSRDVRFKGERRLDWGSAAKGQSIAGGDAIYSGDGSRAIVTLKDGSKIEVGEKSLVRFVKINGESMTDLSLGTFRLKVDGAVNVAINGEVTRLEGNNSELEIVAMADAKPKIKLVKGNAKMRGRHAIASPVPETKREIIPPVAVGEGASSFYHWKLDDLFERVGDHYARRDHVPLWLTVARAIKWADAGSGRYRIEHSQDPNFQSGVREYNTEKQEFVLGELHRGLNYWRVSRDDRKWSKTASFRLETGLHPLQTTFDSNVQHVELGDEYVDYQVRWLPPAEAKPVGYIVESSIEPKFANASTIGIWTPVPEMRFRANFAQTLYYRIIAVTEGQELSRPSEPMTLIVDLPPLLMSPGLPLAKLALKKRANETIQWRGPAKAIKYKVEVLNEDGHVVATRETASESLSVGGLDAGKYRYRVAAVDRWGRVGASSRAKPFDFADDRPIVSQVAAQPTPTPTPAKRAPSSIETSNKGRLEAFTPYSNDRYSDPAVQIEAASYTMFTSKLKRNQEQPLVASIGIRGWKWWGSTGAEGYLKTKVASFNGVGSGVSPIDLEVRAHRRARFRWDWFEFLREIQVSAFLGGEVYQSSTSGGLVSPGYQLAKIGTLISFPFGRKWASGGEVIYGAGLDRSTKFELSGNAFYFFEKNWSLGLGYRAHFFEAGSTSTSPSTLPFREGYMEAFSTLRYNY